MKRLSIYFLLAGVFALTTQAQTPEDALRLSQYDYFGTARSTAMGGAFGALGGDFSSISINPGGIGVYRSSEFTLTAGIHYNLGESTYRNESVDDSNYKLNIPNIGYVTTYKPIRENTDGIISSSFAIGFNRIADFNRNYFIQSSNANSSLLDDFSTYLNNNPNAMNFYTDFYVDVAGNADVLPYDENVPEYYNDFNEAGYGQLQQKIISQKGSINEFMLAYGANLQHKFYFGASLGIQNLYFEQETKYIDSYEGNSQFSDAYTQRFEFDEMQETSGWGFNFKIGAIYKPVETIRLGAALHTPTFYSLNDNFDTYAQAWFRNDVSPSYSDAVPDSYLDFDYNMQTPLRAVFSFATVINKKAIISADYEYVDYSGVKFRDTDGSSASFTSENSIISDMYRAAGSLRIGGEYVTGPVSLRAGYRLMGDGFINLSPYASGEANEDYSKTAYSAGLGIRQDLFFLDFSYVMSVEEQKYFMYDLAPVADIKSTNHFATVTVGFKF